MDVTTTATRRMVLGDIAAVAALEAASFTDPWPATAFFEELALPGRSYVVAERGGAIVGYGGIMTIDDEAHIMTVAVDPVHRGGGLGTRLLVALVEAALDSGVRHLTLEVRESNEPALALYRKFGFAAVGRRPRYYRDEDAVVMWVMDADSPEFRRRIERLREAA